VNRRSLVSHQNLSVVTRGSCAAPARAMIYQGEFGVARKMKLSLVEVSPVASRDNSQEGYAWRRQPSGGYTGCIFTVLKSLLQAFIDP
jgi:hypothetical protein